MFLRELFQPGDNITESETGQRTTLHHIIPELLADEHILRKCIGFSFSCGIRRIRVARDKNRRNLSKHVLFYVPQFVEDIENEPAHVIEPVCGNNGWIIADKH